MSSHHDPLTDLPRMTLTYAQRHFRELLRRAASGEHILITRRGKEGAVVTSSSAPIRLALIDQAAAVPSHSTFRAMSEQGRSTA